MSGEEAEKLAEIYFNGCKGNQDMEYSYIENLIQKIYPLSQKEDVLSRLQVSKGSCITLEKFLNFMADGKVISHAIFERLKQLDENRKLKI